MRLKQLLAAISVISTLLFALPPARAQVATVCVNCGSEVTQYLNYGEMLLQTATTAQQLATQISQYASMIQNLQQLPAQVLGSVVAPFGSQIGDLQKLYSASMSLSTSAGQVQSMITNALQSSAAMGITPSQYSTFLANQAQSQGGVYQQMLTDNNQRLQNLQQTTMAFKTASDNVPNLQGNLDSLAQLNTLAAASGQVATQMLADQKVALSIALKQKADQSAAVNQTTQYTQGVADDLNGNLNAIGAGMTTKRVWK